MRELEGWTAKGGAEGLLCAGGPDGLGIALKVEDGSMRAIRPALAELLRRLGYETGELGVEPVENSRGELVGEVVLRAVERVVEIWLPRIPRVRCSIRPSMVRAGAPRSGSSCV